MQPDTIVVASGTRFAISDRDGDMDGHTHHGFYTHDTRFLSTMRVALQSKPLNPIAADRLDRSIASFYCVNHGQREYPGGAMSIVRDRLVTTSMHEDINLVNHATQSHTVCLEVTFDADFADVFEVRQGTFQKAGRITLEPTEEADFCFVYRRKNLVFKTLVRLTGHPVISGHTARFELTLAPKEQWKTCISVLPVADEAPIPVSCVTDIVGSPFGAVERKPEAVLAALEPPTAGPLRTVPTLETNNRALATVYEAAISDLRSLNMEYIPGYPILAAGLPWYMAVFGRDSIISAWQTKLLGPDLMIGTLKTLAALQSLVRDDSRDAEPGKIPHEIRVGELSLMEDTPHLRYYGTVDATPLFLRLLYTAYQWTGDLNLVKSLLPAAKAACAWMDLYGDRDGDGFIEYQRRTPRGLQNQGWKDSHDSIAFRDGTQAEGPIALIEVQGYAYEAKRVMADLMRILGEHETADRLTNEANELKQRVNDAFWMPAEGFFALALDGQKRQVNAIASNPGHLLWSGILDPPRARAVADRLLAPDMFNGWGIRTLSTEMALYNPLSYHNGSVWPHDNSLIAAGMQRYGFHGEALRVAEAVIDAATAVPNNRLPELYAGYPRRDLAFPVPYPAANVPQAWACGAIISFIETALGVQVQGDELEALPLDKRWSGIQLVGVPFLNEKVTI